jgi:3-oxoacyl-[acyl-carrier-protein] synthase II
VQERQVVISGTSALTPLGDTTDAIFAALCAGGSATGLEAGFDTSGCASRVVGRLPAGTDLSVGMRKDQTKYFRKNTKVMCRDIQLAVGAVGRAVAEAGLALGDMATEPILPAIDHSRFGILYGAGFIPIELPELAATIMAAREPDGSINMTKWGRDGIQLAFPLWLLKYLPNMLACHVGIIWDCQGPSNTITCNDASGLLAAGEAFRHLARGTADMMLTGAAESKVHPSLLLRHHLLGNATTHYQDRPESAHRPFDVCRDGYACAEGSAALIMETVDNAARRGQKPLALVAGFGSSCAATTANVPETSGQAIRLAIRAALRDAKLKPADIDVVVAQGSGTIGQDIAEATAIRETVGNVPVTAFSGGMGNIGAAQGIVGAAVACRMIAASCVPPIRNCEELDPRCPINAVRGRTVERRVGTVLVLSAAISGQAAALILRNT